MIIHVSHHVFKSIIPSSHNIDHVRFPEHDALYKKKLYSYERKTQKVLDVIFFICHINHYIYLRGLI